MNKMVVPASLAEDDGINFFGGKAWHWEEWCGVV